VSSRISGVELRSLNTEGGRRIKLNNDPLTPSPCVTCFVFYDIIDSWHEKSKNPKKREREKEKNDVYVRMYMEG
jgi:hypothetical protein